jgi:hypothetical protein
MTTTKIEGVEGGPQAQVIGGFSFDNGNVGVSVQERISPLAQAMRGGSVSDDVTLGLAGGIGVLGLDVSGTLSRSTYEVTNIDLSVTAFAVTVGVSLNPKNGVSLQAGKRRCPL